MNQTMQQQLSNVRVALFGPAPKPRPVSRAARAIAKQVRVAATPNTQCHVNVNSVTVRFPF